MKNSDVGEKPSHSGISLEIRLKMFYFLIFLKKKERKKTLDKTEPSLFFLFKDYFLLWYFFLRVNISLRVSNNKVKAI